ncbi:MAG: DUF4178 domain-containing protein [Kofleriaceae bacterium]
MRTTCPNCGAPIEFRYDDSFVRVCASCNFAVQRTDRGVDSLGKVADLVPIDSPLKLFAEGHQGHESFLLVGMAQIRHEAGGIWQEWYAKLDGGQWGWLAEAQGRYYLTYEEPWISAPSSVAVGDKIDVPIGGTTKPMTVGEVTSATYASARGELPFKLVPNETFRYADLSDGEGTFATIDFGDDGEPPKLYVGKQVALEELQLTGGEVGPSQDRTLTATALRCPSCSAPVTVRAPGESLRVVCEHCNTLLDTSSGALAILGKLAQRASPRIPLGSQGTFSEGEVTVIGYVQRSALIEGDWWPFDEYLLHAPGLGFRWLVQSDGHWSYVQPIATGAVELSNNGVLYDNVQLARYQLATLRVDQVLGEFYWQVQAGEQVSSEDFIAPPAMVSREFTDNEENWSLSTYLTEHEVQHAFGDKELGLGSPVGIAPNQVDAWRSASAVMAIAFMALIVIGLVFAMTAKNEQKLSQEVSLGGGPGPVLAPLPTPPGVTLSDPKLIPVCAELEAVIASATACKAAPQSQRDSFRAMFDALFVASEPQVLTDACTSALAGAHQAFDGTCTLPTHAQYLATLPGAGSGSADAANELTTAPADSIFFSDPIQIAGGRNIELSFDARGLSNDWIYIAADLVEQSTGAVISAEASMEYYAGIDDGDSWSEGTHQSSTTFGPQPAGTYVLRLEAQHGTPGLMPIHVTLKQGVFRGKWLAWAMLLLGLPLLVVGLVSYFHEKKRWDNSNAGKAPVTPVTILILAFVGVFIAIAFVLKAMKEGNSDD